MKSFVKFTLALLVVASILPISDASAGRRHRRGCGGGGCGYSACGPAGCNVYTAAPVEGKYAPVQGPMQAPVQAPGK